ncbi:PLP-dependent aminotransferase family protein [Rhabdothermincola salaria]|uniref:aminotransferase-like domain-containing protein n=1 Tax=Rhabdothermincola salaria TaxID=2903142 RepID=UPI001E54EF72|nr:PLP-dependent aminotransferase family protein [Rhabdothermincola salaria]MCD9625522.1 PLP-dependent aminotransferase family protein [Rhabdothermincola salaria]
MDLGASEAISAKYSTRARLFAPPLGSAPADGVRINFDQGLPDPSLFPIDELRRCLDATLAEDGDEALRYFGAGGPEEMQYGHLGLRAELARRLAERDERALDPAGVTLVNGSTDGLALVANAFLGPGDGAVIEALTYPHTRRFIAATGATVRTVPVDDDGMVVDALPQVLDELRAEGCTPKLVATIPTFHAPTGTVLPVHRRRALVDMAVEHDVMVLEDNCYYHFGYDTAPPPTLRSFDEQGVVIQSDSFSKYVAPGLRLAWVAGHPAAVEGVVRARQDFSVSALLARAIERFCRSGDFDRHIELLRARYRHKRDVTTAALREHCEPLVAFREPAGGFYFWLRVADDVDWLHARELAAADGVAVRPGDQFVDGDAGPRFVRLSPIQVPDAEIEPGIALLGRALRAARRDHARS